MTMLLFLASICLLVVMIWKAAFPITPSYHLVDYQNEWMTVRKVSGSSEKIIRFYGSCTVWHYESGRRCSTLTESMLSDLWTLDKIRKSPPPLLGESE